jgi:hypothetical protein
MLLYMAFGDVCTHLGSLRASLVELQAAAAAENAAFSQSAAELIALLDEAARAALKAQKATRGPYVNIDAARSALPACQRQFNDLASRFRTELDSRERVAVFEGERRDQVVYRLGLCRTPMMAASRAFSVCWMCMAQYAALNPGGGLPFPPPENAE